MLKAIKTIFTVLFSQVAIAGITFGIAVAITAILFLFLYLVGDL